MKKFSIISLSLMLLIACSKDSDQLASVQGEISVKPSTQKSQTSRVFKGNLFSTINLNPSAPPMSCTGDLPGLALPEHFMHGNATHMGELIWQQSTLIHTSCNLSFATMLLTTDVSGQLSASNVDLIYYSGTDVIDVTNLLTGAGTTGSIEGTWTITGGTGRFDGASGSITINGTVDFNTGTFSCAVNGTITY